MNIIEIIGFVTALLGIWLNAKRSYFSWPFMIISSAAYAFFFIDIRLYADTLLQLFFIVSAAFGWWNWKKNIAENDQLKVKKISLSYILGSISFIGIIGFITGFLFDNYTNADYPYFDSFLFAGSIAATILSALAILENWWLWIIIDALYIFLYLQKDADLTAVLYGVLITLAFMGWRNWRKAL